MILACCALVFVTAGCRAQAPAQKPVSVLNQRIETAIRNELNVPPEYDIAISPQSPSKMAGFNAITVTFSLPGHPNHTQKLRYLVSTDGDTLARLSKFDISQDPDFLLPIEGRPVRGNPRAKVTIVNFDDLECPFCARMHSELFPGIYDHYKGLIKVIYVDFPLTELHPWAMHAAVDANCLAAESHPAYWNFVDYVHTHGEDISGPDHNVTKSFARLDKIAEGEGQRDHLDTAKLDACIAKQDESAVKNEMAAGDKLGISATPTFFVNGVRWSGVLDPAELRMMIDRALRQQGITPPPDADAPATAATASASH
jgi:protein-disulfide isomerase